MTDESQRLLKKPGKNESLSILPVLKMTLSWEKINFKVNTKKGPLKIIENASGSAKPNEITAIMGCSGSGKTSLLSIISGNMKSSPDQEILGSVYLNGTRVTDMLNYHHIRFIEQESNLFECMSPFEILYFQCKLRSNLSNKDTKHRVNKILDELKLNTVAHTPIRGFLSRGLSGGERKRVEIAAELMNCTSVLVLDEPTSGLDSCIAKVLVEIIKRVAMTGITVLFSIHQPGFEVFSMIDKLILIQEAGTFESISYFGKFGFDVPLKTNPPDFYMRLLKIEDRNHYLDEEMRIMNTLRDEYSKNETKQINRNFQCDEKMMDNKGINKQNIFKSVKYLLWREVINNKRNTLINMIKYVQVVTHAILNIMLFHNLGYDSKGIEDRRGLILRLLITVLGISTYSTAIMLTLERKVIMKELSENLYSLNSYLIMKFLGEIPTIIVTCTILVFAFYYPADLNQSSGWNVWILFLAVINSNLQAFIFGCFTAALSKHPIAASAYANVVTNAIIILSGAYTDPESGPRITRWLRYLSPLWFIRNAAYKNEFDELNYDQDVYPEPQEKFNYSGDVLTNLLYTLIHFLVVYLLTYFIYQFFLMKERVKFR